MPPFNPIDKTPGVYIEELLVPGPIPGVGTSTLGIVGPARKGPINKPEFLTNPTQFTDKFGDYITSPLVYATHAVHGFFRNGGTSCYFVRVGTATRAFRNLADDGGATTLVVRAKEEGAAGNAITVQVQRSTTAAATAARASANLTAAPAGNDLTVDNAAGFRPDDVILLEEGANSQRLEIASISSNTIRCKTAIPSVFTAAATIRIDDLEAGRKKFRLSTTAGIEPGSYVTISQAGTSESGVVASVVPAVHSIELDQGLTNAFTMLAADAPVDLAIEAFSLTISGTGFNNLSMDPRHSGYVLSAVTSNDVDVELPDPPNPTPPIGNLPAAIAPSTLGNGTNDDLGALNDSHFRAGIDALEAVDAVTMVSVPDRTNQVIQQYMIAHCEKMQDRFAILDSRRNAGPSNGLVAQRDVVGSRKGYGALYYPWIFISDPSGDGRLKVPPSGHIAGVFARTDNDKGVHKAPANEQIRGVLELERRLTDDEQGPLNEQGINVIRMFRGRGATIWGARTTTPKEETQWRYVNVRRLLLFIEESIQEGTRFAVFEPNNLALWETVKRQVTDFLTRVWKSGALFGAKPEDAFRVRVDEELNPASVRALGQLIIEVVLYPTTPAEFIVFRVIQQPGGPTVQE